MKPGDTIIIQPGQDKGCPCKGCTTAWHEGLFANGDRQRAGICSKLRRMVGTKAGMVSELCPCPEQAGGEVYISPGVKWQPAVFVPWGVSVMTRAEEELGLTPEDGPIASLAYVIRMPIGDMPKLHEAIKQIATAKILYTRTSLNRLEIVEKTWGGGKQ
jgi:hypothetical protein